MVAGRLRCKRRLNRKRIKHRLVPRARLRRVHTVRRSCKGSIHQRRRIDLGARVPLGVQPDQASLGLLNAIERDFSPRMCPTARHADSTIHHLVAPGRPHLIQNTRIMHHVSDNVPSGLEGRINPHSLPTGMRVCSEVVARSRNRENRGCWCSQMPPMVGTTCRLPGACG